MSIQVGIIGGAGYTAGELLRILLQHPEVSIDFIYSTSNAGNPISVVHQDLIGETNLHFSAEINPAVDVVFLCLGHGNSPKFLEAHTFSATTKVIDLSNDFRLNDKQSFLGRDFVYGLPEYQKASIQKAQNIANPGCFATAIQLALLPLAQAGELKEELHVHGVTGSTGAGQSPLATTHFSWRNNNVSVYKAFNHQHLGEIGETIQALQPNFQEAINFIPMRGNFTRGILATIYTYSDRSVEKAQSLFQDYYQDAAFTHVIDQQPHLKQIVNTNKCLIKVEKHRDKLLITSMIDNLLKGASGQAVQNLNLMFNLKETTGLQLKGSYF